MPQSQIETTWEDSNRSIRIPDRRWWARLFAFVGPAYMVSVGYMDPGNWATDLEGGARFGYRLIWVLLMSNAMAVLLQTLSARLGLVTGRDLAQACREEYPPFVRYSLFVLCEIAIAATDLAEVIGSAIGINLLFHIPILIAVLITGFDVLLLLLIQRLGMRKIEGFIVLLIATIGLCFIIEIWLSKPSVAGVLSGFAPHVLSGQELYIAIAILGATVMPHNLYLHSSLVQSRDVARSQPRVKEACRFNLIDSVIAMNGAFLVNAAILIVAAATFYRHGKVVTDLRQAHELLSGLLGPRVAPVAFAIALICSGQSSTVTGTLAGQITMEGFLQFRMRPQVRRLITRLAAIVPAIIVIAVAGEGRVTDLLVFSQVVLCLQLPFAVVPLVRFTSSRRKMGPFASPIWVKLLAWMATVVILVLNTKLIGERVLEWVSLAGMYTWLAGAGLWSVVAAMAVLLAYLIFRPEAKLDGALPVTASQVVDSVHGIARKVRRIGVALEAKPTDAVMLAEALALAKIHRAQLVLMHVVEGVGGQWYGPQTGDMEARQDDIYITDLAAKLRDEPAPEPIQVNTVLGYGNVPQALAKMAREQKLDMLIVGGHGHRRLADIIHGETIQGVRHRLDIPILAVRP